MTENYFELAKTVLTQTATAADILNRTEELLCADPFNPSLIFANGMAALQLYRMNANTVRGIELIRKRPDWIPAKFVDELLPQVDKIFAAQDPVVIDALGLLDLAPVSLKPFDPTRPLADFAPGELASCTSHEIGEYLRYRDAFDANHEHPAFHQLPPLPDSGIVCEDLQLELSTSPSTMPLVIFFQGFYSDFCPERLRVPSYRPKFSQQSLCTQFDPERKMFSRIYLRDYFQVWYQAGLNGRGSASTLASQLESLIATIRPSKVITLGVSAGGYASILFGNLLGAERALSFSPQTIILSDTPGGFYSEYRRQFHERVLKDRPYVVADLAELDLGRTRSRIYYAAENEGDRYHALRLKGKPRCELMSRPSREHGGYINKTLVEGELRRALRKKD